MGLKIYTVDWVNNKGFNRKNFVNLLPAIAFAKKKKAQTTSKKVEVIDGLNGICVWGYYKRR